MDDIDFSKVIIYDVFKHENEEKVDAFSNVIFDGQGSFTRPATEFVIGAYTDNNTPHASPINGEKKWETGAYYLGIVYTNTTHNLSVYHYIDVD